MWLSPSGRLPQLPPVQAAQMAELLGTSGLSAQCSLLLALPGSLKGLM